VRLNPSLPEGVDAATVTSQLINDVKIIDPVSMPVQSPGRCALLRLATNASFNEMFADRCHNDRGSRVFR
jgi:hypothetical protein